MTATLSNLNAATGSEISLAVTTFTGSITAGTTTLTTVNSPGTPAIGMILSGGNIVTGTYIVSGSGTSWTVSTPQPSTTTSAVLTGHHRLMHQGKVVQTVTVTTHTRPTLTALNSGNGSVISTALNLTIVPWRADSTIWLRWTIAYEVSHDSVFLVQQDGTLIGYNTDLGNNRWSGILTPQYDNDYSTTPQVSTINWFVVAGSTASRTYQLCIRSGGGGQPTFVLNRTVSSAGTDGQENGVSHGIAREICG
jgi:hypothetical protein